MWERGYEPGGGVRWVIGQLIRTPDGYVFRYEPDLSEPIREGFDPAWTFPCFPDLGRTYASPCLFPTFANRIPSRSRADHDHMMWAWGVEDPDDEMEVLARSHGRLMGSWITLWDGSYDDGSHPR